MHENKENGKRGARSVIFFGVVCEGLSEKVIPPKPSEGRGEARHVNNKGPDYCGILYRHVTSVLSLNNCSCS